MKNIIKKAKQNWEYYKMGVAEERKNYARMQNIKNTPQEMRSKTDQEWADMMNKTKRRKHKFN